MCGWLDWLPTIRSGSLTFRKVPEISFLDMVLDIVQPISNFFYCDYFLLTNKCLIRSATALV